MEYQDLTVKEIQRALVQQDFTSVDITRAMLETIDAQDALIGGYVSVQHEQALAQAAAADQARRDGKAAPLVIPRMYEPLLSKSKLILCSEIFFAILSSVILIRINSSYCVLAISVPPSSIIVV